MFALKLPLVVVNVATGGLLVWLLVRETGLRPWQATTAAAWFALLPPVTASRMVQAQGGTIEPLFYTLLLWLARRRAVIFGLLFAFGFLHREFTLFAVIAIVLLEVWTGELFSRRRAAHWLVVVLVFLGSRQAVTLLRHTASMFGPDAPPPRLEDGITNVDLVARSVCLSPGPMLGNLWWLIAHNVPTFFGVQAQPPGALILSQQATGAPWAAWPAHRGDGVCGAGRGVSRLALVAASARACRLPSAPADDAVRRRVPEPGRRRDWLQHPEPVHDPVPPAARVRAGGPDGAGLRAGRPAFT